MFMNMFRTLTVDPNSVGSLSPSTSLSAATNTEVSTSSGSFLPASLSSPISASLPPPRRLGKWILCETLGVGGFSKVKLAIDPDSGQKYAIKIMMANTSSGRLSAKHERALHRELRAMQTIVHENVIRLYAWDEDAQYPNTDGTYSPCVYTVLELATGGELFDFLMFTGHFDEVTCRSYFHQLAAGMKACHDAGIAHRDIKPENLLLDEHYVLKIADFGFAQEFRRGDVDYLMRTACGTRGYLSPELLRGESYSHKCDIFACGIILFTLYAGFPPFQQALSTDWWWNKLEIKNYRLFWMAHERTRRFPDDLKELSVNILASNPEERYDWTQILQDPWFNKDVFSHEHLFHHLREARADANKKRAIQSRRHLQAAKENTDRKEITSSRLPSLNPTIATYFARKEKALGTKERFDLATDDWKDAQFHGAFHEFISKHDARATFARIVALCEAKAFTYEMGEAARILMIRAGIGSATDLGAVKNILFAVKAFKLQEVESRYRVVFKRFSGDPKSFCDTVDLILSQPEILDLMDHDMMQAM